MDKGSHLMYVCDHSVCWWDSAWCLIIVISPVFLLNLVSTILSMDALRSSKCLWMLINFKLSREWEKRFECKELLWDHESHRLLGFWVWGPEPGEELAVGSSSTVRFPWAGEEEQGRVVNTLCVSAPCVHRDADKGTVFLSVFDLSGHLSLLLSRCMSVCQCWEHHQLGLGMWNCSSPVSVTKGDEDTLWFPRVA